MLNTFIETFKIKLDDEYKAEFQRLINQSNAENIVIISGLGVLFFLLLSVLDIQRISTGEYFETPVYVGLSITHLLLGFLVFPGYYIYKNFDAIKTGNYGKYKYMLLACLIIMGLSLVPMSVLGSIDKRGLVTFAAYMIIANLVFSLDKKTRDIVNLLSAILVIIGIVYIHREDPVTMVALIIEILGIGFPVYIIASYQYNLRVKQFTNEKILEKQNAIIQQNLEAEYNKRIAEIEMKALRAQMNPHFLFNVLNSIKLYMVQNDAKTASVFLTKFSRLIRLILNNSKSKMVCLADELEALKLYIEMENFRFNDKFDYSIDLDKNVNADDIEIPPLILQPYVENAIWHGLMHKDDGRGKLEIGILKDNGTIQFIIEDNGIGREKSRSLNTRLATSHQSVGMKITKDRIQRTNQLYGLSANVEVVDLKDPENGKAVGTKVLINLPIG